MDLVPSAKKYHLNIFEANCKDLLIYLKAMKRAESCKHSPAAKNMQCEKKLFKSHLHFSKLGKRVEKHASS